MSKALTEMQAEALRLMSLEGVNCRTMSRIIGTPYQHYSKIRTGKKPISRAMAKRVIAGFSRFSANVRPRVNDEGVD